MLDSRSLRLFVTLADELHYGRAADRLDIARSVLSEHIRRLEDVLGTQLLSRNRRAAVRLTRAGELFLVEARDALRGLERAENIGRAAGRIETGPIRVGYVFSAVMNGVLGSSLRHLRESRPDLEVQLSPMETPRQIAAIAQGALDIGFVRPRPSYPPDVDVRIIHREGLILVHSRDHRLQALRSVRASDLAGETLVVPHLDAQSDITLAGQALIMRAGPSLTPVSVPDFASAIGMAASGLGVVLAPASFARWRVAGARYRRLEDFSPLVALGVACRRSDYGGVAEGITAVLSSGSDRATGGAP